MKITLLHTLDAVEPPVDPVLDQLEGAIDDCEDVANTLESIVLKHA